AVLDAQSVDPLAVALRMPAEVQVHGRDLQVPRRPDLEWDIFTEHVAEPFDAPVVNHVLEPGPLAVAAVPVVAEQLENALGHLQDLVRLDPANVAGELREG